MATKSAEPNPTQDAEATKRVQELLERGCTLGIAIDSNYYITRGGGTLDVAFRSKLAGWKGRFWHLTPSIWEREIKRHIRSRIENAKEKVLNVSERDISILHSADAISAIKSLRAAAEAVDAAETANSLWEQFVAETHVTVVNPSHDSAATVLDWYFDQRLPFEGAGDKKHEFPDAFALHSLSRFATDNNLQVVVVVTKDSGAYGHCAKAEKLLAFRDVQSALGAFDARDLIERRRQLSAEASKAVDGTRLAKLMERLVGHINRPYQHGQQPWAAITKPSFPQNPRIMIDELLEYELIPFGNFGMPVSITNIFDGSAGGFGSGVGLRVNVRVRAMVSCEISAKDTNSPTSNTHRQRFPIESPVDADVVIDFASAFPFPDGDPVASIFGVDHGGPPYRGIMGVEVDPLHVTVPDNFEFRGFA